MALRTRRMQSLIVATALTYYLYFLLGSRTAPATAPAEVNDSGDDLGYRERFPLAWDHVHMSGGEGGGMFVAVLLLAVREMI